MTNLKLASRRRRFFAMTIDWIIFLVLGAVSSLLFPFFGCVLIFFFYAPILESSEVQGTLGKHWLGLQVTDLAGERLTFRMALIRNITKVFSSLCFFLGHLMAFFTEKKQSLHDLVADTLVVKVEGESEKNLSVVDAWIKQVKELYYRNFSKNKEADGKISALERLQGLREKNAITEEEFQKEKEKILN